MQDHNNPTSNSGEESDEIRYPRTDGLEPQLRPEAPNPKEGSDDDEGIPVGTEVHTANGTIHVVTGREILQYFQKGGWEGDPEMAPEMGRASRTPEENATVEEETGRPEEEQPDRDAFHGTSAQFDG